MARVAPEATQPRIACSRHVHVSNVGSRSEYYITSSAFSVLKAHNRHFEQGEGAHSLNIYRSIHAKMEEPYLQVVG